MAYNKETGMYEGFIYKIWNDIDSNDIYIGQTIRTVDIRFKEHKYYARSNKLHSHLYNAMRADGIDHFHIQILEKFEFSNLIDLESMLNEREIKLIKYYRDINYNVLNDSDGGDTAPGAYSKQPVLQYSLKCELIQQYDSMSEASAKTGVRANYIAACCSGNKPLISAGGYIWRKTDNPLSDDEIVKYINRYSHGVSNNGVKVSRYSLDKQYIDSFDSMAEASRATNSNIGSISAVCLNKNKTAGGYIWRYYEDDISTYKYDPYIKKKPEVIHDRSNLSKKGYTYKYDIQVEQRDIYSGELLNIYNNYLDASIQTKINQHSIINCCNGIIYSAGGYHWCFIDQFDDNVLNKIKSNTSYDVYTKNGDYIKTLYSLSECYDFLGMHNSSVGSDINQVCKGNRKTARGYIWRFSGDHYILNDKEVKYA